MKIPLKEYWDLLARYLGPQWRAASLLALLLLGNIGLQLAGPQIMRRFIDAVQAGAASGALFRIALLFLGLALVQQIISVLATYVSENVGWTATNDLRADLAEHCLRLDLSFHNAHTPGELIERIDGDVTTLAGFFSQFVIQVAGNGLLLGGVLVLLLREDRHIGLALAAFALVALFTLVRLQNVAVPHWTAERQASADLFGFLEERLAGTEDVRANGAKAYVMRRFYGLMREQMRKALRAGLMVNILMNVLTLLIGLGTALAFLLSARLFRAGAVTIGTVYLVFRYTTMLQGPLERITRQLQELQRATAGIVRVRELLQVESKLSEPSSPSPALPLGALGVAFRDVSFAYHDGPAPGSGRSTAEGQDEQTVLRGLTFHLHPGTALGLLGRTGSGKTTLTRLLFRLYDPDSGVVALGRDGPGQTLVDLRRLPLLELRQRIGMVTQNVQLFHGTLRDNLTFFDPNIPDERMLAVIGELGLAEWLVALPEGLDTVLESGGGGLSAGQAQLLALTRVFLHDPGLVILDEASSRLDPATEALVERAVERLVHGDDRTALIIAHRLSTVRRADEIMILEEGRIIEHGSRPALAADPASRFYQLLQTGLEEVLA